MVDPRLQRARDKAAQIGRDMKAEYARADKLPDGTEKTAAYAAAKDLAVKFSEANAEVAALEAECKIREDAEAAAAPYLDPSRPPVQRHGQPADDSALPRAHAAAMRPFLQSGPAAAREVFLANGGPQTALTRGYVDPRNSTEIGIVAGDATRGGILIPETWKPYRDPGIVGTVMRSLVTVEPSEGTIVIPSGDEISPAESHWTRSNHRAASKEQDGDLFNGSKLEQHDWNPPVLPVDQQTLLNRGANIERIVATKLFRLSERSVEWAITRGNGTGKPKGFYNGGLDTVKSGHASKFTVPGILNLIYNIKSNFAANLTFVCDRPTYAAILATPDEAGNYVFQIGHFAAPETILGIPVKFNAEMDAFGANKKPLVLANWPLLYTLNPNPASERVLRFDDSNYAPGAGFAITAIMGGDVTEKRAGLFQLIAEG